MSFLLSIILLATLVAAQANHVIHGFEYFACVNMTSDKFTAFVNFPSAYTPEQCQSACTGFDIAAAFADGCRCGRKIESLPKVEESLCANPCNGNAEFGFCGFSSPTGCSYANIYLACDDFPSTWNPVTTASPPAITFSTIRLPTITRTIRLATKSTVVIHTVTPGSLSTSCPLNHDHVPTPTISGHPVDPVVVVQTVVVHVPPKSSSGLQGYDRTRSDPPVPTRPPAETHAIPPQTASNSLSLTTLIPYGDPPIPAGPIFGNATITTSPEGPEFRTMLPDDPGATATTLIPAVVTVAQAHRATAGIAGIVAIAFLAASI